MVGGYSGMSHYYLGVDGISYIDQVSVANNCKVEITGSNAGHCEYTTVTYAPEPVEITSDEIDKWFDECGKNIVIVERVNNYHMRRGCEGHWKYGLELFGVRVGAKGLIL